MPTKRQKLVAHHVIGLGKSISATAKQIGASPTSVRGSLISYCIKMMPSLEPELTAWVEHKDRGRHRLAVIRAHKDQLMPSVDQPTRRKPMSEEQQAVETAAENCEVLRARLAKYEDADGNPKAQPSGVVLPERAIKDGGKFSTELKVTGWNACLDEVARLNSSPVRASDELGHDTKGSRKALGAMNAKLRAKIGRLERELAALSANHSELARQMVLDGWCVRQVSDDGDVGFVVGAPRDEAGVRASTSVWEGDSDPAHLLLWHMFAAAPSAGSQGGDV